MPSNGTRYDDLRALFFNCTLKRSPERSNTQGLVDVSAAIMQKKAWRWKRSARPTTTSPPVYGRT
jgi:hypothetical protein